MNEAYRNLLLNTAKKAVKFGLTQNSVLPIKLNDFDNPLIQIQASFVTLHLNGKLRGCIGTLEAYQALILDIVQNAYNAAFKDPRFFSVSDEEFPHLHYHISILTPPTTLTFISEKELLNQITPNIDGIILSDGEKKGTFLPSVWEQLPDKHFFLKQLKIKAGFSPDYWSNTLTAQRYSVENIKST